MKKIIALLLVMALFAISLVGCGGDAATEETTGTAGESTGPYTIGVSNGYIGNGWRTQMLDSIEDLAAFYEGQGLVDDVIIQNAGVDVNTQIAQIRNMINSGVDLLMIDPNSETALNPVIEEAKAAGIPVIAFDAPVDNDYALNVVIDQAEWGKKLAEWFVEQLGGSGDIVIVSGIAGHPANVNRLIGMKEVLDQYPDINVLAEVNGNWDQASSQQAMSNLLASYPEIDGVLTQDGMALGVVNAFVAADREIPVVTGELMMGYVKKWKELKDTVGFASFGQNNPPGIGATALGIGVRLLQGKEMKDLEGNTFYYPVQMNVDNNNLDAVFEEYQFEPDAYFIDEWMSEEQLDALFD